MPINQSVSSSSPASFSVSSASLYHSSNNMSTSSYGHMSHNMGAISQGMINCNPMGNVQNMHGMAGGAMNGVNIPMTNSGPMSANQMMNQQQWSQQNSNSIDFQSNNGYSNQLGQNYAVRFLLKNIFLSLFYHLINAF